MAISTFLYAKLKSNKLYQIIYKPFKLNIYEMRWT
jgi:hypothetical protein